MSRFPSAGHLCSWAGLVPGHNESAGKRKSSKTRKGNKHLRSALAEAANSVIRSENYLGAQYRRIAVRRGHQRAIIAVGHSILTIVYHLLKNQQDYKELGSQYFELRKQDYVIKQSIHKLESLGFKVTLTSVS
jgi:transposase